jgi:hypothetical protein
MLNEFPWKVVPIIIVYIVVLELYSWTNPHSVSCYPSFIKRGTYSCEKMFFFFGKPPSPFLLKSSPVDYGHVHVHMQWHAGNAFGYVLCYVNVCRTVFFPSNHLWLIPRWFKLWIRTVHVYNSFRHDFLEKTHSLMLIFKHNDRRIMIDWKGHENIIGSSFTAVVMLSKIKVVHYFLSLFQYIIAFTILN